MPGRYGHLRPHIEAFSEKRGRKVIIEPHGSQGPDFEDVPFLDVVGEIKHAGELNRDLKGYWSQWNSNQSLSSGVKGWLAVAHGQLWH